MPAAVNRGIYRSGQKLDPAAESVIVTLRKFVFVVVNRAIVFVTGRVNLCVDSFLGFRWASSSTFTISTLHSRYIMISFGSLDFVANQLGDN